MTYKLLYVFIGLLLCNSIIFSQSNVTLFATVSYNTFSMGDLHNFQKEFLNDFQSSNIPTKIVEEFPGFYGFHGGFLIPLLNEENYTLSVGGLVGYTSTGGRIHYKDYSGEVRVDQIVHATNIGAILNYKIPYSENFTVEYQILTHYVYSDLSNEFYSKIWDVSQTQILNFSSQSFGIEPGIVPSIKIWNLHIGLIFSYFLYFQSNLEHNGVTGAYLIDDNGDEIKIDWSGFRTGIQFEISF